MCNVQLLARTAFQPLCKPLHIWTLLTMPTARTYKIFVLIRFDCVWPFVNDSSTDLQRPRFVSAYLSYSRFANSPLSF